MYGGRYKIDTKLCMTHFFPVLGGFKEFRKYFQVHFCEKIRKSTLKSFEKYCQSVFLECINQNVFFPTTLVFCLLFWYRQRCSIFGKIGKILRKQKKKFRKIFSRIWKNIGGTLERWVLTPILGRKNPRKNTENPEQSWKS